MTTTSLAILLAFATAVALLTVCLWWIERNHRLALEAWTAEMLDLERLAHEAELSLQAALHRQQTQVLAETVDELKRAKSTAIRQELAQAAPNAWFRCEDGRFIGPFARN